MKVYFKLITSIVIISLVCSSTIWAGMADWTREDSEQQSIKDIKEQEERNKNKEGKSDNYFLKDLKVEGYEIFPSFKKDITSYRIEKETNDNSIIIKAIPEDANAKVEGDGEIQLNTGTNNIEVKVTAENGYTTIYNIIVSNNSTAKTSTLKDIRVFGIENNNKFDINLTPEFDSKIYSYTCEINSFIEKIDVSYELGNSNSKVEIIGNYDLPEYENTFILKCSEDEATETIYKIVVYNKKKSETNTSVINKEKDNEKKGKTLVVAIGLLIILVIIGLIITLIKKKQKTKSKHLR